MQPGASEKGIKECTDKSTFVHSCQDQYTIIFNSRVFFHRKNKNVIRNTSKLIQ